MDNLTARFLRAKRKLFDKIYGQRLNPEQCKAVFTTNGPLLVLAGAGSGKTTVLVNRIEYIIRYGNAYFDDNLPYEINEEMTQALEGAIDLSREEIELILLDLASNPPQPWQVLAITFTNKAANEIKERLARTFNDESVSDGIWAGTFHSVCMRILRKFADRLGYAQGFSIYDADDTKKLITHCMKELSIDEKRLAPRAVAHEISMAKDRLITPEEYENTSDPRAKDIIRIYKLYQKKLGEYNAVDFDDIIMKTVELLRQDSEVREYYQSKFKYVLVDEYQDTNYAQFVLTKLLSDKYRNIMVVGDDDQSIYRFRGATVENILGFDKTYPDAKVVKLEQNYRSTENILSVANAVIGHNDKRHAKRLWCDKGSGDKITVRESADQIDEGRYIVDKINALVRNEGKRYSDFAVLYRVNELARSLETTFKKSGVPVKIVGSMRFYDHKEIKDMIAYLQIINSPSDNMRLKRIINEPKRKIGDATVSAVETIATEEGVSMYEIMSRADKYTALSKVKDKLIDFVALIEKIKVKSERPSEIISSVFYDTGYYEMLKSEGFESEKKIDNVNELISGAVEYERQCEENETEPTLVGYLEEIMLVSEVDKYDESDDKVVLMTIHSAKGLEFPIVFIAGMEDGIFPSRQDMGEEDAMCEERRLAYVAITRAREKLYITYARDRMMYGRTLYGKLSVFVREEVPDTLIIREGVRKNTSYGTTHTFTESREKRLSELYRRPEVMKKPEKKDASSFGVEKLTAGTRVAHAMFGPGTVVSSRDMGGDVLYEVKFDTGVTKKLMATYAKLKKIN